LKPCPAPAVLLQHEDLLFEIGTPDTTGVDLPAPKGTKNRLGGVARKVPIGLPGLSEPEAVRHYMRLSQKNYAIDPWPVSRWARAR
jgi:glycine dehydrogenase subunit 2